MPQFKIPTIELEKHYTSTVNIYTITTLAADGIVEYLIVSFNNL